MLKQEDKIETAVEPTVVLGDLPPLPAAAEEVIAAAREAVCAEVNYCFQIGLFSKLSLAQQLVDEKYDPVKHAPWRNAAGMLDQRAQNLRILGRVLTPELCPPEWYRELQDAVHESDLALQTVKQLRLFAAAFGGPGPDVGNEMYKPLPKEVVEELRRAGDMIMSADFQKYFVEFLARQPRPNLGRSLSL